MLDPKILRENAQQIAERLKTRGYDFPVEDYQNLESQRKALQITTQELQNRRNLSAKSIGQAKAKGEDIQPLLKEVEGLGKELDDNNQQLHEIQNRLNEIIYSVPNLPHPDTPIGKNEKDNLEIRRWGEPPTFDFPIKQHHELGEALGLMDFQISVKLAGSRFVVLYQDFVRLHRALTQFMIDIHRDEHGYQEIYVPFIVNAETLYGTGQLPKFENDQFKVNGEHEYYLIPTAEVPVTNIARDTIFEADQLPKHYVCHTPCFRREAGTYGRDTQGMLRQHQFEKVELVSLVKPEDSYDTLESLTQHAEVILQRLNLPYRVVILCTADIGFSAAKTYDLEVWLPGQDTYREISSCSNCEDFQARRMKARWRNPETNKPELIHTLNGSGLAVGRTLIALVENNQQANGDILIPGALQPYMKGQKLITRLK